MKFKTKIDFIKNLIYVECIVDETLTVDIDLYSDKENIFSWKNIQYSYRNEFWYGLTIKFEDIYNIHIKIHNDNYYQEDFFKNRNKYGNFIKPVLLNICNKVGLGDIICLTPTIRKLSKIYNNKISDRKSVV